MNPTTSYWKDYIIPVIGLVGTLVTVIATWAKDLNASAHRIRTLDEATKRAVFWDTWSKALAAADPQASQATLTSKVKTEVLAAAETVEKAFHVLAVQQASEAHAIQEHQRSQDSIPRLRRWLLLYKPPRARAWIPRIFFYIYLFYTPFFPFLMGSDERWASVGGGLILIFVFRGLSIWAEKPRGVVQSR